MNHGDEGAARVTGPSAGGEPGIAILLPRTVGRRPEQAEEPTAWTGTIPPKPGPGPLAQGTCRLCRAPLRHVLVDLGNSPWGEVFPDARQIDEMEQFYPLRVLVCNRCLLVQLQQSVPAAGRVDDGDSCPPPFAAGGVERPADHCGMIARRLRLGGLSRVVEIGCGDGRLLRNFPGCGIPNVLGVETRAHLAAEAVRQGVPVWVDDFGEELARRIVVEHGWADLVLANDILGQVPDLNDFLRGLRVLLKPDGVAVLEFGHVQRLMEGNRFDVIDHGHLDYFSGLSFRTAACRHGLAFYDVEELPEHGGSLRAYLAHEGRQPPGSNVPALLAREAASGLQRLETYTTFGVRVRAAKRKLLACLIEAKDAGRSIVGYGAPARGNRLLNYCGIGPDLLDFIVDPDPLKQGRFTPGTHVRVLPVEALEAARPDLVLILPGNPPREVFTLLRRIGAWGGSLVVPLPEVTVIDPRDPEYSHLMAEPRGLRPAPGQTVAA